MGGSALRTGLASASPPLPKGRDGLDSPSSLGVQGEGGQEETQDGFFLACFTALCFCELGTLGGAAKGLSTAHAWKREEERGQGNVGWGHRVTGRESKIVSYREEAAQIEVEKEREKERGESEGTGSGQSGGSALYGQDSARKAGGKSRHVIPHLDPAVTVGERGGKAEGGGHGRKKKKEERESC